MVIDTSILIDHLRKLNRTNTIFANLPLNTPLYVSSLTVYELFFGATTPLKQLEAQQIISAMHILPIDEEVAVLAARLSQSMRSNSIGLADTLIAATALRNNLPIKTLNVRHFARVEGLVLV